MFKKMGTQFLENLEALNHCFRALKVKPPLGGEWGLGCSGVAGLGRSRGGGWRHWIGGNETIFWHRVKHLFGKKNYFFIFGWTKLLENIFFKKQVFFLK